MHERKSKDTTHGGDVLEEKRLDLEQVLGADDWLDEHEEEKEGKANKERTAKERRLA